MLPNLRKANLVGCRFDGDCWPRYTAGTSSVTELEIRGPQEDYMYPESTALWNTFENLKILRLHFEHGYLKFVEGWRERQRYVEALISQAHSLEDL